MLCVCVVCVCCVCVVSTGTNNVIVVRSQMHMFNNCHCFGTPVRNRLQ